MTNSQAKLPDFLIIGAPKSGTTSLYHYLQQHPQVWMPPVKEPHWFLFDGPEPPSFGGPNDVVRRREMIQSWNDYQRLFGAAPPGRVYGEASVRYLYSAQACAAIKRRLPDVRLIAILRHPVDRAYSAYQRDRIAGVERCVTFAEAMADCSRREREGWLRGIHRSLGYYGRHLSGWYRAFPPGQIRVYLYEELKQDQDGLIHDLFDFIGAAPDFRPDVSQRYNVTGVIRNPAWRFLWTGTRTLRSHLMPLIPTTLRGRLFGLASRLPVARVAAEPLDADLRAEFTDIYREDILALQDLIGRDLSHWLDGSGSSDPSNVANRDQDQVR